MEYALDMPVCRMCLIERYPYAAAALGGAFLYFFPQHIYSHRWLKYFILVSFLISMGLSCYHIALEHNLFDLPSFCRGSFVHLKTIETLREHILNQKIIIPCNVVPLRIFFLSLAEWNGVASLALLGASWILLRKK